MGSRTILHVNVVGLMAAIEENLEASLRSRPFVIANERAARAVVLDLSPEAHREGLRRGMPLARARDWISGLPVRDPRPDLYALADEALGRICRSFSPLVEPAGMGHVFLDLAGTSRLNGPAEDAAQKIRRDIRSETGLRPVLALAGSKTVSKVATRVFRPTGFVALSPKEEILLLRRQPVGLLPGVGPVLLGRLDLLGIHSIGDLADFSEAEARALGSRGPELVARSRGVDSSPVDPEPLGRRAAKALHVFEPDTADREILRIRLAALSSELGYALRRDGLGASRIQVGLCYTDGPRSEAAVRSSRLLSRDDEIARLALSAFERARTRRVRIRKMTLVLSELASAGPELDLFEPAEARLVRLESALDRVRARYGLWAIAPATFLASPFSGRDETSPAIVSGRAPPAGAV